jgi:hypothetical protein
MDNGGCELGGDSVVGADSTTEVLAPPVSDCFDGVGSSRAPAPRTAPPPTTTAAITATAETTRAIRFRLLVPACIIDPLT